MDLEVLGEVVDALREEGDLHLGRAGVAVVALVGLDRGLLGRQRALLCSDVPRGGRPRRRREHHAAANATTDPGMVPGADSQPIPTSRSRVASAGHRHRCRDASRRRRPHVRFAAGPGARRRRLGDSIAVNGCCLTLVDQGEGWWEADVSDETLIRTNLGALAARRPRQPRAAGATRGPARRVTSCSGHVDGVGAMVAPAPGPRRAGAGRELMRYLVEKGSIAVDGISLTVFDADRRHLPVAVIPHTAAVTTLGARAPAAPVNLEVDVLAKHVERLLQAHLP